MTRGGLRFAKNAAANIVNGAAAAVVSIILPHFFVKDFAGPEFSLWILILQLGAFVNFLNFGLQVAIGRYVAVALGREDKVEANAIIGGGIQILLMLGVAGLLLTGIVTLSIPYVFRQIQPGLIPLAQTTLLWVGSALSIGLPASGFLGAIIGLQHNEVPAAINVLGKAALGIVLVSAADRTHSLMAVAHGFFLVSVLTYGLQYMAFRLVYRDWQFPRWRACAVARRELVSYCLSLSVWSVSMLLVGGIDTTIVGAFDYRSVAPYGVAASAGNFFAGSFAALLAPLIQVFARHHTRGEVSANLRLLDVASFLCAMALLLSGVWMVALEHFGFGLWVGPDLARRAFPFFILLVLSNAIRQSGSPYALYLLGSGQQKRVMLTPIMEGISNFICSMIGAWLMGAIGVAVGALIGATVGIAANFFYNMRRTLPADFSPTRYARDNVTLPILVVLPCLIVLIFGRFSEAFGLTVFGLSVCSLVIVGMIWQVVKFRMSLVL